MWRDRRNKTAVSHEEGDGFSTPEDNRARPARADAMSNQPSSDSVLTRDDPGVSQPVKSQRPSRGPFNAFVWRSSSLFGAWILGFGFASAVRLATEPSFDFFDVEAPITTNTKPR